jgi:hypothetical protein
MKNLSYLIVIFVICASYFLKKSYDESYNILNQNNESKNLLIEKLLVSQTKNLNLLNDKILIDSVINTSNDEFRVFFYFGSTLILMK